MKKILFSLVLLISFMHINAQITVDKSNKYLITKDDGKPFFWMADTGWELFHRLSREEAIDYLETRKDQEFNVIMAVVLAELNGLDKPNFYGRLPFLDLQTLEWDESEGNESEDYDYWDHMDYIINEAAERDMHIGLLPTWGDKVAYNWGAGPMIFNNNPDKAYEFSKKLAERYRDQWNIIWILGGDRTAVYEREGISHDDRPVWRAMAKGIREICGDEVFITYHTGWPETTQFYPNEEWLSMHTLQSGHGSRTVKSWEVIRSMLKTQNELPVIDLETCYEDHPVNPWDGKWSKSEKGYFDDYDVRARIYRGVFAGGCGIAYGHHHVWQFLDTTRNAPVFIGDTIIGWRNGIHADGANQLKHLKDLMLSRKDFNRIEDNSLVVSDKGSDYKDEIIATRNKKGSYAMIYLPKPDSVTVDMDVLSDGIKSVFCFNPVTGKFTSLENKNLEGLHTFSPSSDIQKDWVLVVDVIDADSDITIYVTSNDRSQDFNKKSVSFNAGINISPTTIKLDPSTRYQTIDGFGAAITGSTAFNLMQMTQENRTKFLKETFSPTEGMGQNYVRISIGCSDFSLSEYSLCDTPGIDNFGLTSEETEYVIPILKEILSINPDLKIMGSPWTPPKWMKVNNLTDLKPFNSWTSGHLNPAYYSDYALYFVKWIEIMKKYGIDIYSVTPQNEPLNRGNSASLYMGWKEQFEFVQNHLVTQFKKADLNTKIYLFDHNYNYDNIEEEDGYPMNIYDAGIDSEIVVGAAYHNYGGDKNELLKFQSKYPDRELVFTETSIGTWNDGQNLEYRLIDDMREVALGTVNNGSKAVIVWNLMLDSERGPNRDGGCQTCYGAVDIDSSDYSTITKNSHYYIIGHLSSVVKPGAVRIGTNEISDLGLVYSAFENKDGTYAFVLLNSNSESRNITLDDGNQHFSYEAPANSVVSYKWKK